MMERSPTDRVLVMVDPQRWLPVLLDDLTRATALDPKVQAATDLLVDRFGGLSEQQQVEVLTVLWASVRNRLHAGMDPDFARRGFADGARTLELVEIALGSRFSHAALTMFATESHRLTSAEGRLADILSAPSQEVREFLESRKSASAGDFGVLKLAALAGVGTAVVIAEVEAAIHGHPGPLTHGHP